ncbi:hypothetical protein EV138_7273 [Kribbella voronezhensis]|uniref:Uncharacterized protein n=1 Tax=Kribbella voronezhensis TaxID=2512212 RepID=A0A4V3FIG7_9ACTN|nr:hypothetical protein EV138_7273 [Kribbella voronezhensis]
MRCAVRTRAGRVQRCLGTLRTSCVGPRASPARFGHHRTQLCAAPAGHPASPASVPPSARSLRSGVAARVRVGLLVVGVCRCRVVVWCRATPWRPRTLRWRCRSRGAAAHALRLVRACRVAGGGCLRCEVAMAWLSPRSLRWWCGLVVGVCRCEVTVLYDGVVAATQRASQLPVRWCRCCVVLVKVRGCGLVVVGVWRCEVTVLYGGVVAATRRASSRPSGGAAAALCS